MARRNFDRATAAIPAVVDFKTGKGIEKAGIPVICSQIHLYREKKGMEQKALAKAIGVTGNAISNWENGRARPDVNLIPAICETLGITLYDLFSLPDPNNGNTETEQQLLDSFHQLTAGHRMAVTNLITNLIAVQKTDQCPEIRQLLLMGKPLAAGIGDPTELDEAGEPFYVYASEEADRADYIFVVNGDSMTPDYHDGDMVFLESLPICSRLSYGDVGA